MEIEYEAEVPDDVHELLNSIIFKIRGHEVVSGALRTEVIDELLALKKLLTEPIYGTVEVEPMDWADMD